MIAGARAAESGSAPSVEAKGGGKQRRTARRRPIRIGAVVAIALSAGLAVWLIAGDSGVEERPGAIAAHAASAAEIEELAGSLDHPLYWAGPLRNMTYELTRTESGRVYVRYLPRGVPIGSRDPDYLTIGTYPQANGYAAVQAAGTEPGATSRRLSGGALVVYNSDRPRSVYFSFPEAPFQVEVFDPRPRRARDLTQSGTIQRVG